MNDRKQGGQVISLGYDFGKPDLLPGIKLKAALREELIEAGGVHPSRVDEYLAALTSEAVRKGGKKKPNIADYSQPVCVAEILKINYGPTFKA